MSRAGDEREEPTANRNLTRAVAIFSQARAEATEARAIGDHDAAVRSRAAMRYSHDALTRALWHWQPIGDRAH